MRQDIDLDPVREYFLGLQERICTAAESEDGRASFKRDSLEGERGGLARPWVLSGGQVFEKAAVNFSHTAGQELPTAATARHPELAGSSFEAVSISLILHPHNPYVPTSHANLRCFRASRGNTSVAWWFGGGFDLTPFYGFEEDAIHWHQTAKAACEPFGAHIYPRFKKHCDDYFYLRHRQETRGVGGLFFDDLKTPDFETCFRLVRSIGDHYLPAYLPIVRRRRGHAYGERERQFQLQRRGRYVEFNLLYDRGTLFGLQAGGRVESILASMPPLVRWPYDQWPEDGTEEARLYKDFLRPRDWLALESVQEGSAQST